MKKPVKNPIVDIVHPVNKATKRAPDAAKISTKKCPQCGDTHLLLFTSINKKACVVCHIEIDWYLEEGQKSLY